MARIITTQLAVKIAKKLGAVMRSGRAHDHADIFYDGKLIATFGIRRGSNQNQGHDHIAKDLYVGPHDAKLLAQCPLKLEGWLKILKDKGIILPP